MHTFLKPDLLEHKLNLLVSRLVARWGRSGSLSWRRILSTVGARRLERNKAVYVQQLFPRLYENPYTIQLDRDISVVVTE